MLQSGPDEEILKEIMEKHDAVSANTDNYVCIIGEAFYDAESGDDKELAEASRPESSRAVRQAGKRQKATPPPI